MRSARVMRRVASSACAVAVLAAVAVPASSAIGATEPSRTAPGPASIAWSTCSDQVLADAHAQCGFVRVPLDYTRPHGPKIDIAVSRVLHSASTPRYQGVMLVNPGGPGAPGLELATLGQYVPNHVGEQYDWIGFDPRGVGTSKPAMSCVPDYFAGDRPPFVPTTQSILDTWLRRSQQYAQACAQHTPQLLAHMKTTDSARDMDSIRAALGVRRISYYGFSYGTYLGQVYATLFPQRVNRMVLDSNVDPRLVWFQFGLRQAAGIERNMDLWFAWLAQRDATYHLGATGFAVRRVFYQQDAKLARHAAAGGVVGPDEWEDAFYAAAYTQSVWALFGGFFSQFVHHGDASGVLAAYQNFDTPGDDNLAAVSSAVSCTDAPFPRNWKVVGADYWRVFRIAPFVTWNIAWYNGPCLYWKAPAGVPVDVDGHEVHALLVDETLDAATPFEGSLEVRRRFPNSSLLAEPGGTTHAGTLFGNACVDGHIAAFLATGALPARKPGNRADAFCAPLPEPDAPAPAASGRARSRAALVVVPARAG